MQRLFGAILATAIVAMLPVPSTAQERERSKPEHPAVTHTERAPAAPRTERPAPVRVERPAPVRVERPAPVRVERPAPVRVERPAPVRVERPAPVRVERPAPARIERPAPRPRIERPAPVRIERPAPHPRMERPAPIRVERPAPVRIERPAPRPRVERPRSTFVQVISPREIVRPRIVERRSSFVRVFPRSVVFHAPQAVQIVRLPQVVQQPAYVYTTYPQVVQFSAMPSWLYYLNPPDIGYYQPSYYNQPYAPFYASNFAGCDNDEDNDDYGDCNTNFDNGNPYYGNQYNQYAAYPAYNVYGAPFGNSVLQGVVVANQGSSLLVLTPNLRPVIVDAAFANQFGRGVGNVAPGTMIEAIGFYQGNTFVATALT